MSSISLSFFSFVNGGRVLIGDKNKTGKENTDIKNWTNCEITMNQQHINHITDHQINYQK